MTSVPFRKAAAEAGEAHGTVSPHRHNPLGEEIDAALEALLPTSTVARADVVDILRLLLAHRDRAVQLAAEAIIRRAKKSPFTVASLEGKTLGDIVKEHKEIGKSIWLLSAWARNLSGQEVMLLVRSTFPSKA